jgi:hypothetical protein
LNRGRCLLLSLNRHALARRDVRLSEEADGSSARAWRISNVQCRQRIDFRGAGGLFGDNDRVAARLDPRVVDRPTLAADRRGGDRRRPRPRATER